MEEGIVRVEYSGVYELGDIGHIGLGFVTRGVRGPLLESSRTWVEGSAASWGTEGSVVPVRTQV